MERLEDGTWLGHVAEHVALELQRESGAHIYRGKTRSAGEPGQYNVIYGYGEEQVGVEAGRLAVRLVNHLVEAEEGFDFLAELESLILLAERRAFGPSTQALIDEAASRDIPWIRLERGLAGAARPGQVPAAHPGHHDVDHACPRPSTSPATRSSPRSSSARPGLPVPRSRRSCAPRHEAVQAARTVGFPVVTKPLDGNHGRGVGLDLRDDDAVRRGVRAAPRPRPAAAS